MQAISPVLCEEKSVLLDKSKRSHVISTVVVVVSCGQGKTERIHSKVDIGPCSLLIRLHSHPQVIFSCSVVLVSNTPLRVASSHRYWLTIYMHPSLLPALGDGLFLLALGLLSALG